MIRAVAEAGLAAEYPFEPRFLDLEAGRMHYLDEGPRAGEPLLMLHGNPTWSFAFRRLVRAFAGERRCVVPDHIGCGLSDKPQGWSYTLAGHVGNLERLVLELDLARITLVLHDWGGAIGMGLARRHPERIARLVVLNTAAFPGPAPLSLRACRAPGLGPFLVRRLNAFAGLAPRFAASRPLSAAARTGLALPYRTARDRVAVARFVQDIPLSPRHPSWPELAAIEAALPRFAALPACIVWGERDFVFTRHFRDEWKARLPRAEVHSLPEAGHWLLEDAPDEVLAALRGFLARHPLP